MAKIDAFFEVMRKLRASDLHLDPGGPPVMRVDGRLRPVEYQPLTEAMIKALVYEILSERQIEELEEEKDLDFAYSVPGVARIRANAFFKSTGLGASFRMVPFEIPPLESFPCAATLERLCGFRDGLVLATGPTGCGKSTTLASMIDHINATRADHIVTLEDPIEFIHTPKRAIISQREIGAHCESFARGLRATMREDPDVVLVGEMRDLETISLAITAAETGHLVFGTLHTRSASKTVERIIDVFPQDRQSQIRTLVAESLRGVVSQLLVERADGKGRTPVMEIMIVNQAISNLIRERKTFQIRSILATGKREGMQTFDQHLSECIMRRIIRPEVAERFATNPEALPKRVEPPKSASKPGPKPAPAPTPG